jgi:hypothetical protein
VPGEAAGALAGRVVIVTGAARFSTFSTIPPRDLYVK